MTTPDVTPNVRRGRLQDATDVRDAPALLRLLDTVTAALADGRLTATEGLAIARDLCRALPAVLEAYVSAQRAVRREARIHKESERRAHDVHEQRHGYRIPRKGDAPQQWADCVAAARELVEADEPAADPPSTPAPPPAT